MVECKESVCYEGGLALRRCQRGCAGVGGAARAWALPTVRPISTGCFARTCRGRHRRAQGAETSGSTQAPFRAARTSAWLGGGQLGERHRCGCGCRPLAFGVDSRAAVLNSPPRAARLSACRCWAAVLPNSPLFLQRALHGRLGAAADSIRREAQTSDSVRDDALTLQAYMGCRARRQGIHLSKHPWTL